MSRLLSLSMSPKVSTSSHDPSPTLHWPREVASGLLQKSLALSRVSNAMH